MSVEPTEKVELFLPGPVRFKGQPCPRFWEMEEAQTDFGKIETSPTGLLHLMLAEFGLIYSNDWFMLPHPMDINTVCEIRGILVDDTFGRHTFVRPAGRGPETAWQRFAHVPPHATAAAEAGANSFYLAPTVGHVLREPSARARQFPARRDGEHGVGRRSHRARRRWGGASAATCATRPPRGRRLRPEATR